jgi:hypothetical protein
MRFKALKELGYKIVPDEWIKQDGELTEAEKQRFIIADNIPFGEYDWDILANEWDKDELIEWGVEFPESIDEINETRGNKYNNEEMPEIELHKLAYRIEACTKIECNKAIELFAGRGALSFWYKRIFKTIITNDKNKYEGIDHNSNIKTDEFIKTILLDNLDFDMIDFDDEGTPAKELQLFFETIRNKKKDNFILAITDGNGLNLKSLGKLNFQKTYLQRVNEVVKCSINDYYDFVNIFRTFIVNLSTKYQFEYEELSLYLKDSGNVIYATYLIKCKNKV